MVLVVMKSKDHWWLYQSRGCFIQISYQVIHKDEIPKMVCCSLLTRTFLNIYPTLVNMFYANLIYANGVITSEVKKHQISLSLEDFVEICNLRCLSPHNLEIDQDDEFISSASFFFLQDLNYDIPYLILVGSVCPYIRLVHYVINQIPVPKKHNLG